MERNEQIYKAAIENCRESGDLAVLVRDTFREAAEWADEHPKEGLVSIDKVIDWLMKHINDYIVKGRDIDYMFDDLRKAMEGRV